MDTVFHLITRYLDGGAEVTTRNTLFSLLEADEEYNLHLGTGYEHDKKNLEQLESKGIITTVFPLIRHYNPITAIFAILTVAWYLRREEVDVLHTHSTEAGIIGRLAAFFAQTPIVIHEIHGDPITDDRNPILNAFLRTMERQCAKVSDRLIVKADRIRELYLDRGIGRPEQYERIYHGVDLSRFDKTATHDASKRILFVGRLERGKGLFDLLEAFKAVDNVKLLIAGDGTLYDPLADEIRDQGLNVELLGYHDDVPSLMASADVFVLPSYREGTPRVITEAMAASLPVIATDIAGIPEQVQDGETGYLVEPGDVRSLANRLEELLNDPQKRAQFGQAGRERVDQFALETAQDRYGKLYRELTGSYRNRPV